MVHEIITRNLWYETRSGRATITQVELSVRIEPLVILGEAGMGKSHLLGWLSTFPGYSWCTARQLINRHDPRTLLNDNNVLVIDALDEVIAQREGDAVDLVLRRLGELGYPRFVLSCRVSDWRSATGLEAIKEQYNEEPLELHLEPFDLDDAVTYLRMQLGAEAAEEVVSHFSDRGLESLLGNPQTLDLIARVAGATNLPETRSELFAQAIEILRTEERGTKAYDQPARESGLDAVGAAFAGLILTGSEAIVRGTANPEEGELQLSDIALLPGGNMLGSMLGTRLFRGDGTDRVTYLHRRIGEFLGARWLAKHADTKRKRRRLLSLFHRGQLVPASLRGIHAWLAREPDLAEAVIAADPMGVIEYGDADELALNQARTLLKSLESLASQNPRFRNWQPYSVRGIVQPDLISDVKRLITASDTPFGLRLLVLQAIKGANIALDMANELRTVALNRDIAFSNRKAAGEALIELAIEHEWPAFVETLRDYGDDLSIRLAIELIDKIGYAPFDDEILVSLVFAHTREGNTTIGVLFGMERHLPNSRLDGVLDRLAAVAMAQGRSHDRRANHELADFAYHLMSRRVELGNVAAETLWTWLVPFDADAGYHQEPRQSLDAFISNNHVLRRGIQRLVLLEMPGEKTVWQRAWRLSRRLPGLAPNVDDILALLAVLDPNNRADERWRDVIQLTKHDGEIGSEVREAARIFASHRSDLAAWVEQLASPSVPEWKIKDDQRLRKQRSRQRAKHAEHRRNFEAHIDRVRMGDDAWVIAPAQAYLKLFDDIGDDLPAHERIQAWLGSDVAEAAHLGFAAFLNKVPAKPTATEIAVSLAQGRRWDAAYVIVAALAERFRQAIGFDDLPDERLLAGFFELRRHRIDTHAGIEGLNAAIEATLRTRGVWREAMVQYHEPQLEAKRDHVDGLSELMRTDTQDALGVELASAWLARYPDLPNSVEMELVDQLIRSGKFEDLRRLAAERSNLVDDERRRNWEAIRVIVNFEAISERLICSGVEPQLLWNLRERAGGRYGDGRGIEFTSAQLEWIITTFRQLWPGVDHPRGGTVGDSNPWDASDYLAQLINRLGKDYSDAAMAAMQRLLQGPADGYTETIRVAAAEQARIRVDATYVPPTLSAIDSIMRGGKPMDAADLQASVLEELAIVQDKVKSDDAESWRGFYDDAGVPFAEERCRDHLLGLLRQGDGDIAFDPETHVARDKEVDISCAVGVLRMPIEIKGQWHRELWRGADAQLNELYAQDWRAERRGVYLVLWFGEQSDTTKQLRGQRKGVPRPRTPRQLCEMLTAESTAASDGRIVVFVLDVTRR